MGFWAGVIDIISSIPSKGAIVVGRFTGHRHSRPYNTLLAAKAEEQKKRIESVRQLSMIYAIG